MNLTHERFHQVESWILRNGGLWRPRAMPCTFRTRGPNASLNCCACTKMPMAASATHWSRTAGIPTPHPTAR